MQKIADALDLIINAFLRNSKLVLVVLLLLWLVHLVNWMVRYRLSIFLGIVPRRLFGLRGIPFFSFLHGDANHLFFNSLPFFVLANLVMLHGHTEFYVVSLFIIVVSGFGIWLVGKRGVHIGASALIMGYFGFLLADAYFKLNAMTIVLALICLYYFGGLALSLFPSSEKHVSWEGHVCGFLAGIAASYSSPFLIWLFNTLGSTLT